MSDSDGSGSDELPNERTEPPLWIDDTGDYRYLREAYYRSQDAELSGRPMLPSCLEALDAFLTPITLLKASLADIPVPKYRLANDSFSVAAPALVLSVPAFRTKYRLVRDSNSLTTTIDEMSCRQMYPVLIEQLDQGDTVREFFVFKGRTRDERDQRLAERFFEVFRVPIARLIAVDGEAGLRLAGALPVLHARRLDGLRPRPAAAAVAGSHTAPRLLVPGRAVTRAARMR